jgi:hypothetical protein
MDVIQKVAVLTGRTLSLLFFCKTGRTAQRHRSDQQPFSEAKSIRADALLETAFRIHVVEEITARSDFYILDLIAH